jgi:hypothetical protein
MGILGVLSNLRDGRVAANLIKVAQIC